MNALDLWHECRRLGIVLCANGERLRYDGPTDAVRHLLPALKANRDALLECVQVLDGALIDPETGSPFLPWGFAIHGDLSRMRGELIVTIHTLADLEGWPHELREAIVRRAVCGPAYDAAPNLAWFRDRLAAARDEIAVRAATAAQSWRFDPAKR
ncbi:hypothetical protein [Paraburkholderia guartelaensis]|uniref:hypothetical protein n=1 Tax=Paraburkholderia guartelaensis TaxID=2546446 RepID=UPI002AB6A598|nr:hypothetical protein [Paraburkholderia guartelaensis]